MELFFNSEEYKKMKGDYERTCFKLIGKYCINTGDKLVEKSASEIHEYFKNKKLTVEYVEQQTTKKGTTISTTKEITKNFYQVWSEDPEMNEYLEVVFNCDTLKVLPTQYNLFEGFTHFNNLKVEQKLDLEPIFEHMKSLVNYNEEHFKYVISWLAQLIQQPHILPHTTLIFISEEGVGKDLFSKFISNVINDKYTHNTEKLENICGKFNSILGGKLLITVNETNPVESRERIENIKFLITADKITIEGKHKDPIKTDNFCRFIFFSNRLFAFPVEEGSRRPVIFKASNKYLPANFGAEQNKNYFTNLADNIYGKKEYQKAFLEYLKSYDITKFNPKDITKSELHQELEENSISPIVHYLAHIVKSNTKTFRVGTDDCYADFLNFLKLKHYRYEISDTKFKVEMTSTYKIPKVKNSTIKFVFNIEEIRKMLETKYKFKFDDEIEDEEEETPLDAGVKKSEETNFAELYYNNIMNEDILKSELDKLKEQMKQLQDQLKESEKNKYEYKERAEKAEYKIWYDGLNESDRYQEDMKKYHNDCATASENGWSFNPMRPKQPVIPKELEEIPKVKKNKSTKHIKTESIVEEEDLEELEKLFKKHIE